MPTKKPKTLENGPVTHNDTNSLRQELDTKIDKKLSTSIFFWITGILFTTFTGALAYAVKDANQANDAIQKLEVKMAVIDDRVKELDDKLNMKR